VTNGSTAPAAESLTLGRLDFASAARLSRRRFVILVSILLSGCASAPPVNPGQGLTQGEPIRLDTVDPKHAAYLTLVRQKIEANWRYPCVKSASTGDCEYKSAHVVVEFGILKGGRVQFVRVQESSGVSTYDDAAVEAIERSSPFPEVPAAMMTATKKDSTGVAILARFNYVLAVPAAR
jgi:TonB family protein